MIEDARQAAKRDIPIFGLGHGCGSAVLVESSLKVQSPVFYEISSIFNCFAQSSFFFIAYKSQVRSHGSKIEVRRWLLEYQGSGVAERGWDCQYLKDSLPKAKNIREGDEIVVPLL